MDGTSEKPRCAELVEPQPGAGCGAPAGRVTVDPHLDPLKHAPRRGASASASIPSQHLRALSAREDGPPRIRSKSRNTRMEISIPRVCRCFATVLEPGRGAEVPRKPSLLPGRISASHSAGRDSSSSGTTEKNFAGEIREASRQRHAAAGPPSSASRDMYMF